MRCGPGHRQGQFEMARAGERAAPPAPKVPGKRQPPPPTPRPRPASRRHAHGRRSRGARRPAASARRETRHRTFSVASPSASEEFVMPCLPLAPLKLTGCPWRACAPPPTAAAAGSSRRPRQKPVTRRSRTSWWTGWPRSPASSF